MIPCYNSANKLWAPADNSDLKISTSLLTVAHFPFGAVPGMYISFFKLDNQIIVLAIKELTERDDKAQNSIIEPFVMQRHQRCAVWSEAWLKIIWWVYRSPKISDQASFLPLQLFLEAEGELSRDHQLMGLISYPVITNLRA